jgi:hypothetical protein
MWQPARQIVQLLAGSNLSSELGKDLLAMVGGHHRDLRPSDEVEAEKLPLHLRAYRLPFLPHRRLTVWGRSDEIASAPVWPIRSRLLSPLRRWPGWRSGSTPTLKYRGIGGSTYIRPAEQVRQGDPSNKRMAQPPLSGRAKRPCARLRIYESGVDDVF